MALTNKARQLNRELSLVLYCKRDIGRIRQAIDISREAILGSKQTYPTRGIGGLPSSEAQRYAEIIDDKCKELERAKIQLIEARGVVKSILGSYDFEELEESIFYARYAEGMRWGEVAAKMGYAKRYVIKLWGRKINTL